MIPRSQPGFTLIELMVVIGVLAVLATFALPSMSELMASTRVRTAASDLYDSLLFARSESIKRNAEVSIVPNAGGWAAGWEVKVGATVLQASEPLSGVSVTADAAGDVRFAMSGRAISAVRRLTLSSPTQPSVSARCVMLDASGRPTVRIDKDGDPTNGCV